MTCPRSIAPAIAVAGVALASSHAWADDRLATVATDPAPPPTKHEPTGTFEIGAGYNSDEGFLATARIAQSDLFGTGHGLSLNTGISALRQDFTMAYDIPKLGGGSDLHAEIFARERRYPGFARDSAGGMLELGTQVSRSTRTFMRYRAEHVTVTPEAGGSLDHLGRRLSGDLGNGMISAVGVGLAYDTRDSHLPTRGSRLELYAETATRELGSDHEFVKVAAKADHATALGPFTLRLSGRATSITSSAPGGVPLSERLLHDGNADIRGFALGSLDGGAWDRGANFEALGRVELELPVWKRAGLSLAGFFDVGYRENTDPAWGPLGGAMHRSVGGSIIWRSPIGPLRFDLAFPLDGADRDRRFLFGIGFPL